MVKDSATYINPLTDFGFKYLFGQEENKDFLISFLNSLHILDSQIEDVEFVDKEKVSENKEGRALIYDIHCTTTDGGSIIVEMQNRYQTYFNDRALYYLSRAVSGQGHRGDAWDYQLTPVYGVFLMNFEWREDASQHLRDDIVLMNKRTHRIFTDKLGMTFLKLPLLTKSAEECRERMDKWIYLIKNMDKMEAIPTQFMNDPVFKRLESVARVGALEPTERRAYEASLKQYRDWNAVVAGGMEQGRTEGLAEGFAQGRSEGLAEGLASGRAAEKIETIKRLASLGLDCDSIAAGVGMPAEEVRKYL